MSLSALQIKTLCIDNFFCSIFTFHELHVYLLIYALISAISSSNSQNIGKTSKDFKRGQGLRQAIHRRNLNMTVAGFSRCVDMLVLIGARSHWRSEN